MILGDREDECLKQNQTRWRASFILCSPGIPQMAMVVWWIFQKAQHDLNVTRVVCHSAVNWIPVTALNYQSISLQLTLA